MVTWSEVKFDPTKGIFVAKNSCGDTFYIDIYSICRLDEKKLLDVSYFEGMKSKTQQENGFFHFQMNTNDTQWNKIPQAVLPQINRISSNPHVVLPAVQST